MSHKKMIVWQNIDKLDIMVQDHILLKIPRNRYKLRDQIDSASDSIGANFVEGYYSGSLLEYLRFLRYAKRSLGELHERVRRVWRKKFIDENIYDKFENMVWPTMYLFNRLITALELKKNKPKSHDSHAAF